MASNPSFFEYQIDLYEDQKLSKPIKENPRTFRLDFATEDAANLWAQKFFDQIAYAATFFEIPANDGKTYYLLSSELGEARFYKVRNPS